MGVAGKDKGNWKCLGNGEEKEDEEGGAVESASRRVGQTQVSEVKQITSSGSRPCLLMREVTGAVEEGNRCTGEG